MDVVKLILEFVLPIVASIAIAALTPVAVWAGRKLQEKLHLETELALDAQFARIAEQAVYYAEEKGREWARDTVPFEGSDKLSAALEYANARLEEMGLVAASSNALKQLIEGKLNQERPFMSGKAGEALTQ